MPPQRKVQGRIAPAKVSEEAQVIAGLLTADPDAAAARGRELVEAYSLAPRMSIVKELGQRLRGSPPPHPVPAVITLLATQRSGIKFAQEPEYAAAVFELALGCRGADATLAEELVYERIAGGGPGDALSLAPEAIPAALASDPRLVASATGAIVLATRREKLTPDALRRWAELIDPLIRLGRSGSTVMDEGSAGAALAALAALPADQIPPDFLVTAVHLIALCPVRQAGEFYATALGGRVLSWLRIPPTPAPSANGAGTGHADLRDYKEKVRTRLQQVLDEVFVEPPLTPVQNPVPTPNPEPPPTVDPPDTLSRVSELAALKASVEQLEQERDAAWAEVAAVKSDLATASRRLDDTTAELVAARDEAERWKTELKRREGELGGQFRVEQQQENQRQSRLIAPPLREVCEHLVRLLTADRRNEPLRRLAVSFDSLQKNLGRVLSTTDIQRLPQELLARPEEGVTASENAD